MKLVFCIILLLGAYCVQANETNDTKHLNTFGNNIKSKTDATVQKTCNPWKKSDLDSNESKEHEGHDHDHAGIAKPKFVVTFLANSKAIENSDESVENGYQPPFFMDPFQQLLQFFFSSFTRDFTPVIPKEPELIKPHTNQMINSSELSESSEFDWFTPKNEVKMFCEHGKNGFCRSCHMKTKNIVNDPFRLKKEKVFYSIHSNGPNVVNLTTTVISKNGDHTVKRFAKHVKQVNNSLVDSVVTNTSNRPSTASSSTIKHLIKKTTEDVRNKHKQHYFLSISGGTDQRVAASKMSENTESPRVKRNATIEQHPEDVSFFKILEDTIFESLNKDRILRKPEELKFSNSSIARQNDANDTITDNTDNITDNPDDYNVEDPNPYGSVISPVDPEYSHGWAYFFLVTLPVFCTIGVVILCLCICLRTRGWCCKLFLKDPSITYEENRVKHSRKPHRKEDRKRKQIILA